MDEKLFNIVKKGYDQEEVDNYLKELHAVINSYKEKDNAIKNAIINAQISADNIIKNAEIEGDRIKGRAVKLLDEIKDSIEVKKAVTDEFKEEYNHLVKKYLHNQDDADFKRIYGKIAELETYVNDMQRKHEADPSAEVDSSSIVAKMVVGTQKESDASPSGGVDEEMAVAVAELLAEANNENKN